MTPEERRAKYPLEAVKPLSGDEEDALRAKAEAWLVRPTMTARHLDLHYHLVARLLATVEAERTEVIRLQGLVS